MIEDFAHSSKHAPARTAVACALVILATVIGIGCASPGPARATVNSTGTSPRATGG